jgi:hypoxanthine-guanine phosphoribosyltransferase
MKVLAARRRDTDDINYLVKHLGLTSVAEVLAVCASVFPQEPVSDRAILILEDIFDAGSPD